MRSLEKHSANIFRILFRPYLKKFKEKSPEKILERSLKMLDESAVSDLKKYVISCQHPSGGFTDRSGEPDLYYTLFGYFICNAIGLQNILPAAVRFAEDEVRNGDPDDLHLNCASIILSELSEDSSLLKSLKKRIRKNMTGRMERQPGYAAFISLLTCYYTDDFKGLFRIRKNPGSLRNNESFPATVTAALLVLHKSFKKSDRELTRKLDEFYDKSGGFKAVKAAPVADLLSTAAALYSLYFTESDLRIIKPDCLIFISSLFRDGGFGSNISDPDPDIEYTFYGLLALGSLAD